MAKTTDALIIGGGAIGCSIAYQLSKAKIKTIIVEKAEQVGSEASWAAAGMLLIRSSSDDAFDFLSKSSFDLYKPLLEELKDLTQIDVECLNSGSLELLFAQEDEKSALEYCQKQKAHGVEVEFLAPEAVWKLEAAISKRIRIQGAFFYPKDSQLRSPKLVAALAKGASRLGTEILTASPVIDIIKDKKGERIIGVKTPNQMIHCGHLIIAAGCWSNQIGNMLGVEIPVEPVRGQIVLTESMPHLIQHIILTYTKDIFYLVPRADGKILMGSTIELAGYDKRVTLGGVSSLLEKGIKVCPELRQKTAVKTWAGLRPFSKTLYPLIGFMPQLERVVVASGHFKDGILLTPITGKLVKELILGETPSVPLDAFQLKT